MGNMRLTEGERKRISDAWNGSIRNGADPAIAVVEAILTSRLAPIEALAEQWNSTPDYSPSDYDQGRVDQRHDMTAQLLAALAAEPSSDGAGSGAGGLG